MKISKRKLIRDNYVNIIEQDEKTKLVIAPFSERKELLLDKLDEEVAELKEAISKGEKEDITNELVDVFDVVLSLGWYLKCGNVKSRSIDKVSELGRFTNFVVLEEYE